MSLLEFVPEERVAELFHACDAAVLPTGEAGTSGSLILALSMGLPVVAADVPTTRELVRRRGGGLALPAARPVVAPGGARKRRCRSVGGARSWPARDRDR